MNVYRTSYWSNAEEDYIVLHCNSLDFITLLLDNNVSLFSFSYGIFIEKVKEFMF
jgi:hypothetical protein